MYLKPSVKASFRLSLDEGSTPCQECPSLAKELDLEKLYLKREDLNPTGSFKDRSLAYQLSAYLQKGNTKYVISSSGNAAVSAVSYCKLFKCQLTVFVSRKIPKDKLDRLLKSSGIAKLGKSPLQKKNITIYFSDRPRSDAIKFANENKAINLRGSTDDLAIVGFKTITYELAEQTKSIDAVFIPCSSGTSTVGIYKGFKDLGMKLPQIHIIQTTKIHQIACGFDRGFDKSETSLASAIVDKVAHRKEQVIDIVRKTEGSGWVISDKEIEASQKMLRKNCDITASADSALSLAGVVKALNNSFKIKRPVLILSGK